MDDDMRKMLAAYPIGRQQYKKPVCSTRLLTTDNPEYAKLDLMALAEKMNQHPPRITNGRFLRAYASTSDLYIEFETDEIDITIDASAALAADAGKDGAG